MNKLSVIMTVITPKVSDFNRIIFKVRQLLLCIASWAALDDYLNLSFGLGTAIFTSVGNHSLAHPGHLGAIQSTCPKAFKALNGFGT